MAKKILVLPDYAYKAAGSDIDWFHNCASKIDYEICCTVAGQIGLDEKLSKNDIMDIVVLNKYVNNILTKEKLEFCGPTEENTFTDLKDFSLQSLSEPSGSFDMSSMKNLTPWVFESRGDILFIILQDIFVGYMVKGDDLTLVKFIISTLSEFKKYYGEEELVKSPLFKRFIGLVM